jgi:serine/threonine-protein phosphatase 2A regulatory subunit B''
MYLELDADKDGRLSVAEFRAGGGFTQLFAERVFELHVRKGCSGLMDFDSFCDFQLAWRHREHRASLSYFFRVLDVHGRSCLGDEEVRCIIAYSCHTQS